MSVTAPSASNAVPGPAALRSLRHHMAGSRPTTPVKVGRQMTALEKGAPVPARRVPSETLVVGG